MDTWESMHTIIQMSRFLKVFLWFSQNRGGMPEKILIRESKKRTFKKGSNKRDILLNTNEVQITFNALNKQAIRDVFTSHQLITPNYVFDILDKSMRIMDLPVGAYLLSLNRE